MDPHPLLIDIILDKIFGYFKKDGKLLVFRRVCRKWNQIALPKFLQNTTKEFNYGFHPNSKWLQKEWWNHREYYKPQNDLGKYSNYLEKSPGLIYTSVYISISKTFPIGSQSLQKFLRKWGHTLRKLKISWWAWPDEPKPRDFLKVLMLILRCNNLECLSLECIPDIYLKSGLEKGCHSGIKELRMHSSSQVQDSNLAQDLINSCPSTQRFYCKEKPEIVQLFMNSKCLQTLREITVGLLNSSNLRILNETELQLRKVTFQTNDEGRMEMFKFVEKKKNTLISLHITFLPSSDTKIRLEFSGTELQLQHLELNGFSHNDLKQFASIFPNATKLRIDCNDTQSITLWKKLEFLDVNLQSSEDSYWDVTVDNIMAGNFGWTMLNEPLSLSCITGLRGIKVTFFPTSIFKRELLENIGFYAAVYNLPKLELIYIHADRYRLIKIDKFGYTETQLVRSTKLTISMIEA